MSGCDSKLEEPLVWVQLHHFLKFDIQGSEVFQLDVVCVEVLVYQETSVESDVVYSEEADSQECSRLIIVFLLDVWVGLLNNALGVLPENFAVTFLKNEKASLSIYFVRYVFVKIGYM